MNFFVGYRITDAKLLFVYLMHSKRGEPSLHSWPDKQISINVSATLQHFYFDQQVKRFFKHSRNKNFLIFFVDWTIIDVKLFFEAINQWEMIINDKVRPVCVCTCVCVHCWELFLGKEFGQSLPNHCQSWYGQVISLKLD